MQFYPQATLFAVRATGVMSSREEHEASSSTAKEHPEASPPEDAKTTTNEPHLIPLTYYPPPCQRLFARNARAIASEPFSKFFHADLFISSDIPPLIRQPMPLSGMLSIANITSLLDPGYAPHENGWLSLPDGTAYVNSLTRFPSCTGEMIRWWFWWHSLSSSRYALWFPYDHASIRTSVPLSTLSDPAIAHAQKWLGATHHVREFVGTKDMKLRICFVPPEKYGLNWGRLKEAGYEAAVCAELRHAWLPMRMGDFVHLWRRTGEGLELRSRYWLGRGVRLELGVVKVPLDFLGEITGIKKRMAGETIAYEHFIHDQTEFTNLARILPGMWEEWEAGRLGTV